LEGDPLGRCGLSEQDVTDVVVTHLHFDHNGGLTWTGPAGADPPRPRYPQARHWIHRRHLEYGWRPTPKDRASFFPRDFQPVQDAGLFEAIEGEAPACPFADAEWMVAHGHTAYQLLPRFHDGRRVVQFLADLIPTASHLPLPWVMAYDNEPLKTMQEKQRLYDLCASRDLILFFEHDPQVVAARIDFVEGKPRIGEQVQF
jgi:glyoxylase-like metal-dependent hydrolase (beta-lactamase superfamily II)